MRKIVSEEGIRAMWKGVGPAVVRASALTASQLATYDETKQAHPWFQCIQWDMLYEMEAAYKPIVHGDLHTQNFEKFPDLEVPQSAIPSVGPWRKPEVVNKAWTSVDVKRRNQHTKTSIVGSALPETAVSVGIAATVVGAAVTLLVRRTKASETNEVCHLRLGAYISTADLSKSILVHFNSRSTGYTG